MLKAWIDRNVGVEIEPIDRVPEEYEEHFYIPVYDLHVYIVDKNWLEHTYLELKFEVYQYANKLGRWKEDD